MKILPLGAVVAGLLSAGSAYAFDTTSFVGFSDPNADPSTDGTYATGINTSGAVSGYSTSYASGAITTNSFVYSGGSFTAIPAVSKIIGLNGSLSDYSANYAATGISSSGGVIGLATPASGPVTSALYGTPTNAGYGNIPTIATPVAAALAFSGQTAFAPSASGGSSSYLGPRPSSNFSHVTITSVDSNGNLVGNGDNGATLLPFTIAGATQTISNATNNSGLVAGSYFDGTTWHGYTIQAQAGNGVTPASIIDDPNAVLGTFVTALNNNGDLAGFYIDASGNQIGFVDIGGTFTDISAVDLFADAGITDQLTITGLSDNYLITGFYQNNSGLSEGFVGNVPEPATIAVLGAPLALMVARRRSARTVAL